MIAEERKQQLVSMIQTTHPMIQVRTGWTMFDNDQSGIQLHARNAATGNTLCCSLSEETLETLDDMAVMAWVKKAVDDYLGRQKKTRRRVTAERQMDRE